ncbi:MAG: PAS domain S-box protein [Bacteroidales bacterium]|nr:PAS domain S-box protein [Bacteroidales bacterium]
MNIRKLYSHPYSAILAALLTASVFIFMFIYLAVTQRKHIYESSKEVSKEVLRQTAGETQLYFTAAYVVANSIQQRAIILKQKNGTRNDIKNLLKDVLTSNPNILGAWVLWESNAYDQNDSRFNHSNEFPCNGRFGITYFRDNDTLYSEIVPCNDYKSFFYTDAKQKRSAVLSEPYLFRYTNYSNLYFGCTISVPIMSDTAFLGVVGVDINLSFLQNAISSVKLFDTGFLYLVSPKGLIVSYPDSAKIRKNFYLEESRADSAYTAKAFMGNEVSAETYSNYLKERVFRFYYPINLYLSDKPWMVISEIPIEKASSRSRQVVWVATFVMVIGILLIIYLVLNIFERRKYQQRIEDALCEAEKQKANAVESFQNYLEIFNSTSEAIFIYDAETGVIIDVNDQMLKMYGLHSKEEVIGKHVDVFSSGIEPYDANGAQERIKQAIKAGSAVFEWQSKRSDGSIFWSEVSLKFTFISGKKTVLAVVRDVSDRKIAQQALEYRERKFRELADLLPLVVWEVDLNARFTYANNIGFKLFGYTQEDLDKGITIIDLIAPEDRQRVAQNIKKSLY